MVSRRLFLQSSAAVAITAASGIPVASAANAPGVTDAEIKIGQTFPYSGPASRLRRDRQGGGRLFQDDQREGRNQRPQAQPRQC